MRGVSAAARPADQADYIQITLTAEKCTAHLTEFARTTNDTQLLLWSDDVVRTFGIAEKAVIEGDTLDVPAETCRTVLDELATMGRRAYRAMFPAEVRTDLSWWLRRIPSPPATPTFFADVVPFPWEVLYDGAEADPTDPDGFWGFRMAPARILNRLALPRQVHEQPLPSNMLFCLHVDLRDAHLREEPDLRKVVLATAHDRFLVLGAGCGLPAMQDGKALLKYLIDANHTMVHFACHCDPGVGEDVLKLSVLAATPDGDVQLLSLGTNAFLDVDDAEFRTKPLVFMNACHSAGGVDDIRKLFNLPSTFVGRGAGAVIATACPVPDLFAAAFARHFYGLFLGTDPRLTIGEALRQTRRHFLEQHRNPLGLAYGLYTPAQYSLAVSPNAVEAAMVP
jgi:hypothetical protein